MKSTEELSLKTLVNDGKLEEKLALGFKNDMTNLANLMQKLENVHFGVLLGFYPQ